jgi:hypothetical protein
VNINRIPEDDQLDAADPRIRDLSPRKNTDFETQSCEISGKPYPEWWSTSQWASFKGLYTRLIIGQNGKLGCNTCSSVESLGMYNGEWIRISIERSTA